MGLDNSMLGQYLTGAFHFVYQNGFKIDLKPNLKHKSKIRKWLNTKQTETETQEQVELYRKLFTDAMPNEPIENINNFLMIHENETTFLFWKHFNFIKVLDGETYPQWNERVTKELQEELEKKNLKENELKKTSEQS